MYPPTSCCMLSSPSSMSLTYGAFIGSTINKLWKLYTIFVCIFGVVMFLLAPQLVGAFSSNPEVVTFGVGRARVCSLFYFGLGFSHISSAVLRGIDKHDGDARHKRRVAVVSGTDGIAAKQAGVMAARLGRVTAQLDQVRVEKRYDADIWLDAQPSRRPVLVRLEAAELPLGERQLVIPPLYIGRSDHIGLVGDNGCGKTTLVKHLVACMPDGVRVLYVPQEPSEEQQRMARVNLRSLPPEARGRVLSIVAQLNSEPERLLEGDAISPGEMRKLMLALGILDSPELIIMDEPTNHLDLGSTEALERVLSAYPGALLLVSHDAALLGATTSISWRIGRGESDNPTLTVE